MFWSLEGIVFLLVGLRLRDVIAGLASTLPRVVVVSSVAVMITLIDVRVVWPALTARALPALVGRRRATWGESRGDAARRPRRRRLLSIGDDGNLGEAASDRLQHEPDLDQAALLVR